MAKKTDRISKSTPTIISPDLVIEGDIQSRGIIEIQGSIKGTVKGNSIIIREEGSVSGNVHCENLQLKGKIEGEVHAKSINIYGKGFLKGDIEYGILSVEDGALIDGQFKKVNLDDNIADNQELPNSNNQQEQ